MTLRCLVPGDKVFCMKFHGLRLRVRLLLMS